MPELQARSALRSRLENAFPLALSALAASTVFWMPLHPLTAGLYAASIVLFFCYWVVRSYSVAIGCLVGLRRIRQWERTDWMQRFEQWSASHPGAPAWEWPRHLVIIPNYKESEVVLRRTLASLAAQANAEQLVVVLAMEERESAAEGKATRLLLAFRDCFADFFVTYHPPAIPGEAPGKGSNEAWAAREAYRRLIVRDGDEVARYTVTSCDADSVFGPQHFSALNYLFLAEPDRYRAFWQPTIFLTNNIWDVPAPMRMLEGLSGIFRVATLTVPGNVRFPTSCYSLSWRMLYEVDYWDEEVIPEDWHLFLKCAYALGDRVHVVPMFMRVGNDSVRAESAVGTMRARYLQTIRHAWGASDIPYVWRATVRGGRLSRWRGLMLAFNLTKVHVLWASQWFLVTLGVLVPTTLTKRFGGDMPGWWMETTYGLPGIAVHKDMLLQPERWLQPLGLFDLVVRANLPALLMMLCTVPLLVMVITEFRLRGPRPEYMSRLAALRSLLVWPLIAPITLIWATLPAIHAQWRLASGRGLVYRVAEKGSRGGAPTPIATEVARVAVLPRRR